MGGLYSAKSALAHIRAYVILSTLSDKGCNPRPVLPVHLRTMNYPQPSIDFGIDRDDLGFFKDEWEAYKRCCLPTATKQQVVDQLRVCCSAQLRKKLYKKTSKTSNEEELIRAIEDLVIIKADVSGRHIILVRGGYNGVKSKLDQLNTK